MPTTVALPALLDGQHLVQTLGLAGILAVVFAETSVLPVALELLGGRRAARTST